MSVERRASISTCSGTAPKRFSMSGEAGCCTAETRPHTRVQDESAVEKKYKFGAVLGSGSFGVVHLATSTSTKRRFAVKIVQKDKVRPMRVTFSILSVSFGVWCVVW